MNRLEKPDDLETSDSAISEEASGARATTSNLDGERATEQRPLPRMLGERYRLTKLIAKGGMGRVYEAIQLPLERKVAIKLLVAPPNVGGDFRRRFLLEASVCARLTHPNIVVVHDYGETADGELFMAMELLEGQTLDALLAHEGPLEPLRVTKIALSIARAVRAAHAAGVAHRDLKPGNVFVLPSRSDEEGEREAVKVLDFGLVKVYQDGRADVERDLTEGDIMLGSPRYMAPEQIQCEGVDHRCDIYSLGALMFAMVCGRPPFVGRNAIDILTQHIQRPVPSFAEVFRDRGTEPPHPLDPGLEQLVHRCMQKDPDRRYASMDDVIAALRELRDALAGGSTTDSYDSGRVRPVASFDVPAADVALPDVTMEAPAASRPRWPLVAALLAGVLVLGGIIALLVPSSPEPAASPEPAPPPALVTSSPEPAPGAPTVEVAITSEPAGAEVLSGGVLLGVTPLSRALQPTPQGAQRLFELHLEGYERGRVAHAIVGEEVTFHVELTPIAPVEPAPDPEPAPEPEPPARRVRRPEPARTRPAPEPQPERRSIAVDRAGSRVPVVD